MVALLEGLQALARGDAADAVPREPVELGDVVDAAVQAARRRHPAVRFELDDASAEGVVDGWPDGLRMLVDNLLDNAAVHGRADGRVTVRVRPDRAGGVEVVVEDDGPGLHADERRRVLEPFARGARVSAPGTGLGLAVVAQQASIHGGEVRLGDADARPAGRGAAAARGDLTGVTWRAHAAGVLS
jgi:two-component system sensor histidine kinase PrrB